jgi:hypothetical protein
VSACDSGGSNPNTAPDDEISGDAGEVTVKLKRSKIAKSVDSAVDSAFVRVWKTDVYNTAKYVNVPDPGSATEVALEVPATTGMRAGVLAVESDSAIGDSELPYAVGTTNTFEVTANETTNVSPTLQSTQPSFQIPSSVGELEKDTIVVQAEALPEPMAESSINAGFDFSDGNRLNEVFLDSTSTRSRGFEVSGSSDASTIYVKVGIDYALREYTEGTGGQLGLAVYPNPDQFSGESYEIPVSSTETGTVAITFNEDGETRRVVK